MRQRLLRMAASISVGTVALVVMVLLVGPTAVAGAMAAADIPRATSALLASAVTLVAWGSGLWIVLRTLGGRVGVARSVTLFIASTFVNAITPFGQAGGDPFSGILTAMEADVGYPTGLAAMSSINALNQLVAVGLGIGGATALVTGGAARAGTRAAALAAAATTVGLITLAAIAWRHRDTITIGTSTLLTAATRSLWRIGPWRSPAPVGTIERGVEDFVMALERLVGDPGTLGLIVLLSVVGQAGVGITLWLSLASLGAPLPLGMALVIVPVARIAAVAPTPGGFGAIELALVGLLVKGAGTPAEIAAASVLLYRLVAFWLPAAVGGGATAAILLRS